MTQTIHLTVKPGQRQTAVEQTAQGIIVKLTATAHDGAANTQLIVVLAEHYHVPKSKLTLTKGHTSRYKTIELAD